MSEILLESEKVVKEGFLRKRSGRMHQWSYRYFILSQYQSSATSKIQCRIAYKLKSESPSFKGCFDLTPGCVVTDVQTSGISVGNNKLSKKMYTFWIVWPIDKNSKKDQQQFVDQNNSQLSNFEDIGRSGDGDYESGGEDDRNNARRDKDLKKILAQQELESQKVLENRSRAEEQVASHQAHDNNVSLGVKIAAVAAGGAVVGGLTFGIGLIPYAIVLGVTAVAGGTAASTMQWKRPSDSRLIIACETISDAMEWKAAIESEICRLEEVQQPLLPSIVDLHAISSIIHNSTEGQWRNVRSVESVRIMEYYSCGDLLNPIDFIRLKNERLQNLQHRVSKYAAAAMRKYVYAHPFRISTGTFWDSPVGGELCRKAQTIIAGSQPVDVFLELMQSRVWPQRGHVKVIKEVDDHADVIEVSLPMEITNVSKVLRFSRFWKQDDEGIYLVTFNLIKQFDNQDSASSELKEPLLLMDAVISITPIKEAVGKSSAASHRNNACPEALVTCICQISLPSAPPIAPGSEGATKKEAWTKREALHLIDSFLYEHLAGLQNDILVEKFGLLSNCSENHKKIDGKDKSKDMGPAGSSSFTTPSKEVASSQQGAQGLKKERQPFFRRHSSSEAAGQHSKLSRFARRGVTTVQPTLEDSSSSSSLNNDSAAVQSGALSGGEERAISSDGGKMKLFPPSRAAAALIVGGEENLAHQNQTAGADVTVADVKKKNMKLFSLQSKWTGKESASASKSHLLSAMDQGDRVRHVLSPEQIKIQSQISAKESELSKLDREIQKKISAKMDPKSRRPSGKLLSSNSGSYSFFSPPKTAAIHIPNDEDLESLISLQVEVSAQLASLIETYKALSSDLKPSVNGSYLRQDVDLTKLPDGTLISDLAVPLHWVQPTSGEKFNYISMQLLYETAWVQVDRSCALLLEGQSLHEDSQRKMDIVVANALIIFTLIAVFSNIALFEYLIG